MTRDEAARLLHVYADGELDPAASLELEALLAKDAGLRAACERIRELSSAVRDRAEYYRAPDSLASRLRASIPAAPQHALGVRPGRSWIAPAGAFAVAVMLTWLVALATLRPGADERLAGEALAGHVRATLAGRRWDVASSDQHTVKPWLSSRLSYSPPVADFGPQGFELRGARVDTLDGRPVAVLVYQRRLHMIDVWVQPGDGGEARLARDGFNVERFARDGMRYWLVSDLAPDELQELARLLAAR